MFKKILIANRGEIACRVIKSAQKMGIKTVAVYSDADAQALHVQMADEAVHIGPPPANQSYIVIDKIMDAIRQTGAEAVHPGYGFLSENKKFAEALEKEGVAFIGPPSGAIEAMGDKITSKKLAKEAGVSTVPGYMGLIADADEAVKISDEIGYPVMIKASAGGGGKGMRIAWNAEEAREGFQSSKNEAANSFGDDRIFIEKFVTQPRHIEIQVLADKHGNCVYLNERECSIQRRNQKVIEEAPSPFLDPETRKAMGEQAVALSKAVDYCSAGTVEFIVDGEKNFYFLEMNTRLQVEHPVTELITGIDLVEQMIRVADGEKLPMKQEDIGINGWAIESRLYAEDPYRNFLPSIGRLTRYRPPVEGKTASGGIVRNDTGVFEGGEISMFYDPMIAKLCTWGETRDAAIEEMRLALDKFEVEGIGHNLPFCAAVMDHERFTSGNITTAFIEEEYPEGFAGVTLDEGMLRKVAAATAAMERVAEIRRTKISGTLGNHERKVGVDWAVSLQDEDFKLKVNADRNGSTIVFEDGEEMRVESDWTPGDPLAELTVNGAPLVLKVGKIPMGFRIRVRGADLKVHVRTPRQFELAQLMPVKLPPDTSKFLLCPMPGLVVKISVEEGAEVQEGQPLATVEAMKMENILRAEKKGIVKKINAEAGASLAVDDIIMEFE
ncbi:MULTISPECIES: acetyl/propionyl/methylcrotonyl-CoA carboxylase subunit alpha [unclassified Thioclava]|uniref:acetyl-CoA carboxylase biotin carboxylase subunit n=1 Tax=unclassified Thioclava TaxID=2621713 RepID=UPI000B54263B|nr:MULTISPECIES: acetyl/propionyl/methylcrotonyl-CoA carboxylase subunit alpha [unclassified Thioclava]OWY01531.1 acetyl/propionyl-CoA carboxylase subunit alpha [Thioclava sp. IC9]OWY01930.1 acetyl/propionyl-CoA carboxylase subunit alpha [Thioclava sp. F1Mire-8]OWY12120.1 acetyl/propionyl-CoA carboxylase subunit alpha [Thioclava sp. F34-6]OWY17523.1 acetyl/propionyl-CoA carboxylase subunit alpha [Thioclava sp. JM3]PWE49170.1 acetyl/propionyl/methylcrotonyl-CoA carboxylase subunit alpha [Thiocl